MSTSDTTSSAKGHFCPECGSEHEAGAHFCETCGHRFDAGAFAPGPPQPSAFAPGPPQPSAFAPGPPQPSAFQPGPSQPSAFPQNPPRPVGFQPAAPSAAGGPSTGLVLGGLAAVLAAVAVVVVLVVVVGDGGGDERAQSTAPAGPPYAERVATLLAPINESNAALTQDFLTLDRGGDPADALTSARAAERVARSARAGFGTLQTPADAEPLRLAISRGIARQRAYLTAAISALDRPTLARAANLGARAQAARSAWRDTGIEGAGGRIAGVDRAAVWTRDQVSRADRRAREAAAAKARAEAAAKAKAQAEAQARRSQQAFTACGGFEGIVDSFAAGIDCQTALGAVAWQITGNGSSEGFTCDITGVGELGAKVYTCTRPDGARIRFSAHVG